MRFVPVFGFLGAIFAGAHFVQAVFIGIAVAAIWWSMGKIAFIVSEPDRYLAAISKRQCPECGGRLEVTSDEMRHDYREVVLACMDCDETYIVEATLKDHD